MALSLILLFSCKKEMPYNPPPYDPPPYVPPPVPAPVIIHGHDSILSAVYIEEMSDITKVSDTVFNYISLMKFWTTTGKEYNYERVSQRNIVYMSRYNLVDTSGQVIAGTGPWSGWADYYPLNKQVLDSAVFKIQVGENTYQYMYMDSSTKIIATKLASSPIVMSLWLNRQLIQGQWFPYDGKGGYGNGDGIIDPLFISEMYFDSDKPIYDVKDTANNFIYAMEFSAGGKHYRCYVPGYRAIYANDYLQERLDFFDASVEAARFLDTLHWWGWAYYAVNKDLVDKPVFKMQLKNGTRTFYVSNQTRIIGNLYNTSSRFMCNWYNSALQRLKGVRFYETLEMTGNYY